MKVLVYQTETERTFVTYDTRNGYHSFSAENEEYVTYTKDAQREIATDRILECADVSWFADNPTKTYSELVDMVIAERQVLNDMTEYSIDEDGTIKGWEWTSFGQNQDNVPTELCLVWNSLHLKEATEHQTQSVKELLEEYAL